MLFDSWERAFDYTHLKLELERLRKRPLWLLFQRVSQQDPVDLQQLVRYLQVDTNLGPLVLDCFANPIYTVADTDLLDERWAICIWLAGKWNREVQKSFFTEKLDQA